MPEIASRKHIEKINQVIEEALQEADVTLDDIDAIGVTYGPGLVGALLVGVAEAKAIAYAKNLPLVGVHHIEGHIPRITLRIRIWNRRFYVGSFRWTYPSGLCQRIWKI